jgi:hypothetical protein
VRHAVLVVAWVLFPVHASVGAPGLFAAKRRAPTSRHRRAMGRGRSVWKRVARREWGRLRRAARFACLDALQVTEGVLEGLPTLAGIYLNPVFWLAFILAMIVGLFLFAVGIALYWGSDVTYDGLSLLEKILNAIPGLINDAASFFGFGDPVPTFSCKSLIGPFCAADRMGDMAHFCRRFDSVLEVFAFVTQTMGNTHLCPPARFLWGTWAGAVYGGLLGLFYYSAEPAPDGFNCRIPGSLWVCWTANLWRIFLVFYPTFHLLIYPLVSTYRHLAPSILALGINLVVCILMLLMLLLLPLRILLALAAAVDRRRHRKRAPTPVPPPAAPTSTRAAPAQPPAPSPATHRPSSTEFQVLNT